jgi:hypothetical protein
MARRNRGQRAVFLRADRRWEGQIRIGEGRRRSCYARNRRDLIQQACRRRGLPFSAGTQSLRAYPGAKVAPNIERSSGYPSTVFELLVSKEREYAANHHFKGALPSDSRSSALEPLKVFPNLGMGRGGAGDARFADPRRAPIRSSGAPCRPWRGKPLPIDGRGESGFAPARRCEALGQHLLGTVGIQAETAGSHVSRSAGHVRACQSGDQAHRCAHN